MLTHRDLADLTAWLYAASSYDPAQVAASAHKMAELRGRMPVTVLYMSNADAVAVFAIVRVGAYLIVIFRGSYTGRDWLLDVLVTDTNPVGRPSIKRVHSGFYSGTPEAIDIIMMFHRAGDQVIVIGHSLGGGRAEPTAEALVALGAAPRLVVTWGQPAPFKPGSMGVPVYPVTNYRNLSGGDEDPVTYSTDIAGYQHRTPFTDVNAPPANPKWWDPFDLHHFELYQSVTPRTEV